MKSNKPTTRHNLKAARPGWLTAAGAALTVGVYLQLGACGANGSNAGTASTSATNSNTATTTTTATATCDVSTQPACPSTAPSYSGEIENIIATYCLQCHDPNGVGAATTTGVGGGAIGGGRPTNPNDPNAALNPNFTSDPNFTNSNPNRWDPSDAHDWSKYANIHMNATLIEQQVFLCNMPPNGATPLSAADRQILLNWLACNAPNN